MGGRKVWVWSGIVMIWRRGLKIIRGKILEVGKGEMGMIR